MPVEAYYKLVESYALWDQVTAMTFIIAAVFLIAYWAVIKSNRKWLIYLLSTLTLISFTTMMTIFMLIMAEVL